MPLRVRAAETAIGHERPKLATVEVRAEESRCGSTLGQYGVVAGLRARALFWTTGRSPQYSTPASCRPTVPALNPFPAGHFAK